MVRLPIAIAGFMGAGKTTIGRLLAELLGRPFLDTDSHVEEMSGRRVEDYFTAGEEAEFRQLEARAVAELVGRGAVVVALGGGALEAAGSRALLAERAVVVHLHVPWARLRPRIPELASSRPLLQGRSVAEIHRLYLHRLAGYRAAALSITIGRRSAAEAAIEIVTALRSFGDATVAKQPARRDRSAPCGNEEHRGVGNQRQREARRHQHR